MFYLNTVIVAEVDVLGYEEASHIIAEKLYSVDTFGFEYEKEIFRLKRYHTDYHALT